MVPTLRPDAFVLVDPRRQIAVDDLVVATHPEKGIEIAKRVEAITDDGVVLSSDNPAEGSDSRHFGPVAPGAIAGVITHIVSQRT